MMDLFAHMAEKRTANGHEDIMTPEVTVDDFSYDGYQVVRGEFFAHLFEPSVTINNEKVSVNAACIRKLPKVEYVQFLVNPVEKKLAVKPCDEEVRDSFCWASLDSKGKMKPKTISCKIFFAKIMKLMDWDPGLRYKILGKLVKTPTEQLFVFDLTSAEIYMKRGTNGSENTRKAFYPEEWGNQFGLPVSEHQDRILVDIFDDYTVFKIEREAETEEAADGNSNIDRSEEEQNQNP